MKTSKIFVGVNGATLSGFKGGKGIAVYPAQKGSNESYVLLDTGKFAILKGTRINGVGVARFLTENGFVLAEPDNASARILADCVDVQEGIELVESAMSKKAEEMQEMHAGKHLMLVPFDPLCTPRRVTVEHAKGYRTMTSLCDLPSNLRSSPLRVEYERDSTGLTSIALHQGWLVGLDVDVMKLPRNTEHGGLVELAAYVICAAGLASLIGPQNLVLDENVPVDARFAKGQLELALGNGDIVQVGIDFGDVLGVVYLRDGKQLYERAGFSQPRLAEVLGAIAAVLVRVREMDAVPVKKAKLKKAA